MSVQHMMRVLSIKWQEIYDGCPSYDARSIICMMGIHHTLRVPKASRHLQHKHQGRTDDIIMTYNTGIVRAYQHCSNHSENKQRSHPD